MYDYIHVHVGPLINLRQKNLIRMLSFQIFVSIRDLPDVMPYHPERLFGLVEFLAKLPNDIRPYGMMFEEPRGKTLPEEAGQWSKYIRRTMKDNYWCDGHLLFHVHEKFGYCDATALQVCMLLKGVFG
jgi:hypothetical protein